jgi:hypothetical protein
VKRRHRSNPPEKKKHQLQKPRRQEAWLVRERERITKPWRFAIFKLRAQLKEERLGKPPEKRHFQNRRLIQNLFAEFGSSATAAKSALSSYWLFCGSPWQHQLGYDEARQQHYRELKARGFSPKFTPEGDSEGVVSEFLFRLDSLGSWIEAQESWIFWRQSSSEPEAWNRADPKARRQGMHAAILSRLPSITNELSDWALANIVQDLRTWSDPEWVKILKDAARIAERAQGRLELETWVWWRYPIFSRYRWSTAEVCRAAREKFGEIHHVNYEAAFQLFWVRRGLRFTGRRTRRQRRPPLWDFVISEEVPKNVSLKYSLLSWIPYGKSPPQS